MASEDIHDDVNVSLPDLLLNDSRITPTGNGSLVGKDIITSPTSGQKWWAAIILGIVFALISSPVAYSITSQVTESLSGVSSMHGKGPNLMGLIIHTIIFVIIVRIVLW
jgi:hypothetical protein